MVDVKTAVEERYNMLFSQKAVTKRDVDPKEIISELTSKRRSYRFKILDDLGALRDKIAIRVNSGNPIKVCIIWGYGKNGFAFRKHNREWYKPDMADVFTLGVVSEMMKGVEYPLDVTLSYSTARYLNANYYYLGRPPEPWLEEGLHKFAKEFERLCSKLVPSVNVHDCYKLNEKAGVDMEREIRRDYVEREYSRIKGELRFMDMYSHVEKHSSNPAKSLERYAKERIVELSCGVPDADLSIYFSGNVFGSIRYHTTPNRRFPDIIPPWSSQGGIIAYEEGWHERMITHKRIHEMRMEGNPESFNILGNRISGTIYRRKF